MSYEIRPPSVGASFGAGLGSGLSEQIPREVERYRLSSGLKNFANESQGLDPLQAMAQLSGIPGMTPQMIQSMGDLLRMRQRGQAYGRGAIAGGQQPTGRMTRQGGVDQTGEMMMGEQGQPPQSQQPRMTRTGEQPSTSDQIQERNILDPSMREVPPWTPQRRNREISKLLDEGFLVDDAERLAADAEAREREAPSVYKRQYEDLEQKKKDAREELIRKVETKTQKKGDELFKDVTGEMLSATERELQKELRRNPEKALDDITEEYSKKLLDTAKAKTQFNKLAQSTGIESFVKGDTNLKKLYEYGNIFKDSGNSEEYYNLLKSQMKLSPQGAASIAYRPSQKMKSYISSVKPSSTYTGPQKSRQIAAKVMENLNADDSLLSIAWDLRQRDPFFDQKAFFDEISSEQENLRLNSRQRRELAEGASNILPSWGDFLIFPLTR